MSLEDMIAQERKKLGIDLSSSSPQQDLSTLIQAERNKYKVADEAKQRANADAMKVQPLQQQADTSQKHHIAALDFLNNNIIEPTSNFLNRAATSAMDALTLGQGKKQLINHPDNLVTPTFGESLRPAQTTTEKAADIVGNLYGSTAPIMGAYGSGGKLAGGLVAKLAPNAPKFVNSLVRGIGAGTAYGTATEGLDAALGGNKSLGDRAKSIATDAALFGGGDAAFHFAGAGLSALGNKLSGTKIGDAVGNFLGRNKTNVDNSPQQTLALPPASDATLTEFNKRNGKVNVLPPNTDPIYGKGNVETLALPKGNYVQPTRLKVMNGEDSFNSVAPKIFQKATERMTPPLENPNELAKWVKGHLNDAGHDVSLNEVRKLSYEDMLQLADEMKPRINVADTVRKTAHDMGYGKIFDQTNPTVKEKLASDLQSQVYGVPAPKVNIAKPDSFNITHENPVAMPESKIGIVQPKVNPNKAVDKTLNINSQPTPIAPINTNVNVPEGTQAMLTSTPAFRPSVNTTTKEITRKQVVDNLRKNLGVVIRTGRLGNVDPAVQGLFKIKPEVIRTKQASDIQVIAHEVGHTLEKKHPLTNPQFDAELMPLGQVTSAHNYTIDQVRSEGVSEFIRTYLTDPAEALRVAPNYARYVESILSKEVQNALKATQEDIARWIDQGAALRFSGKINREGSENFIQKAVKFAKEPKIKEKFEKFYTNFLDKHYPIAVREKAITGQVNDASESIYKKARRVSNVPKRAELMLKEYKEILKPLDDLGYTTKDMGNFSAALHADDLENLGIQSGFDADEIASTIAKFDSPEMRDIQQKIVGYSNKLLDKLVESERISADSVKVMRDKYPNYVPFNRFFEEDLTSSMSNGGGGFVDLTNPIKRLKGSARDVIDPLESIIKNTFAVIGASEKNKVGLQLANLSKFDGAGKFVERLDGTTSVGKENIVVVYEKGEPVQYQLDSEFYEAMKGMDDGGTAGFYTKVLEKPAKVLRAGATLTPEFIIRNPIRDQYSAYVVSEFGYNPLIDLPAGLFNVIFKDGLTIQGKTIINPSKYYKEWVEAGGGFGNYTSGDRNATAEQLRELTKRNSPLNKGMKVLSPKEWILVLQKFGEITEEATKVGEFRNAVKQGATHEEAAYQSSDLMDFSRIGKLTIQANKVISFLNANGQGKDRMARAFINHPVRTTIRAIKVVTIPTVATYLMYKTMANDTQKETINNAPQWLKDTFFLVPIPNTDVVARIPKPFDLAPVFSNTVENILRWMDNNHPQEMKEFAWSAIKQQVEIPLMMSGIRPIMENLTNYKFFTDSPVVPKRDQGLLHQDQYDPVKTSLTARAIGEATGTSPYKVDNAITGYGAGLAKYATNLIADPLVSVVTGTSKPPAADKNLSEQPFINSFTISNTSGGKVMNDFYKQLDDKNSKAKSAVRNNQPYDGAPLAKALNKIATDIGKIRNVYRDVSNSYEFNSTEKRQKLDELNIIMNEYAKRGLEISKGK